MYFSSPLFPFPLLWACCQNTFFEGTTIFYKSFSQHTTNALKTWNLKIKLSLCICNSFLMFSKHKRVIMLDMIGQCLLFWTFVHLTIPNSIGLWFLYFQCTLTKSMFVHNPRFLNWSFKRHWLRSLYRRINSYCICSSQGIDLYRFQMQQYYLFINLL